VLFDFFFTLFDDFLAQRIIYKVVMNCGEEKVCVLPIALVESSSLINKRSLTEIYKKAKSARGDGSET
jgi:hypothetical protein